MPRNKDISLIMSRLDTIIDDMAVMRARLDILESIVATQDKATVLAETLSQFYNIIAIDTQRKP